MYYLEIMFHINEEVIYLLGIMLPFKGSRLGQLYLIQFLSHSCIPHFFDHSFAYERQIKIHGNYSKVSQALLATPNKKVRVLYLCTNPSFFQNSQFDLRLFSYPSGPLPLKVYYVNLC